MDHLLVSPGANLTSRNAYRGRAPDENGRIKLPNELDPATRAAVKSFEIDKDGSSSTSSGTRRARSIWQ